jgi:protein ImuB
MEVRNPLGPNQVANQMTPPLYIAVHIPEFATQAIVRLRPRLAHAPVVVLAGTPPLDQVCSASPHAVRLGITPGMTRAELETLPSLTVLCRSEPEEQATRAALLEAAGAFTPRIQLWSCSPSAFAMVLDMTGTTLLFGSPQETVTRLASALAALRIVATLAASANVHTAVCLAPSASKAPILVPPTKEKEFLHDLPLSALELTPPQSETLALWGLTTLGELAALPEVDLIVRLGQPGKRLRQLARGEHPHLFVHEQPLFTLEEFLSFDAPIELLDSLLFVLGPMLDQLLARARNRALALASVTLKLGLDGGGEHVRTVKPALPVLQREILLKLLHLDLQAHPPPAGVLSLHLHAEPGDSSKVQLGLFAPQLPEPLRLDVTLARIAALVGPDRVGRARLLDSHRPGDFAMEPFTVTSAKSKSEQPSQKTTPRHAVALRRCRPPVPITMRLEAQRPSTFFLRGTRYTVQEAYGPWRKSGAWWSPEVWSHEEWDLHAQSQAGETLLCLLTQDLLQKHWHLEALYD